MSWSIEFINWNESNGGSAIHTISDDIINIKFDPESITGIDYHKQESRMATVSFLNDNSDFINTNLLTNMIRYEGFNKKRFWEYAVRIKNGSTLMFTGWIKLSSYKYNKKTSIIKLTANDSLAVMVANNNEIPYTQGEHDFWSFLRTSIEQSFAFLGSFGLTAIDNFDYQTGITQTGLQIIITDEDFGYTDWNIVGSEHTTTPSSPWTFNNRYDVLRTIRNVGIDSNGNIKLVVMKYSQTTWNDPIGESWYFFEHITILTCLFDSNFNSYNFVTRGMTSDPYETSNPSPTPPADIQAKIDAESYYNNFYVDEGYPLINVSEYQVNDGDRIYFDGGISVPTVIFWDGMMRFSIIDIKSGLYPVNVLVKMCLMINNLSIKFDNHGNMEIVNKDYTISNIEIGDADILEYKQSSVLASEVDYTSVLAPMVETNVESIANALRDFYAEHIPQYEYNLQIVNDYSLNLNDEIVVYGDSIQIVGINKDLDDFIYTIKAWST